MTHAKLECNGYVNTLFAYSAAWYRAITAPNKHLVGFRVLVRYLTFWLSLNAARELSAKCTGADRYVWYPEVGRGTGNFSIGDTWRALHPYPIEAFWHRVVWFQGRIPKHAFLTWVAARDRMLTRDRLIGWGLSVPSNCVLCAGHDENRQHLFFDCSFSNQIWMFFTSRMQLTPPQGFDEVLRWLKDPSRDKNVILIIRLIHQAVLYLVWKERNKRIHTAESSLQSKKISFSLF
ncbi:PREDICTED: uncharacterized protein LOC106303020 [Brassica oleracea var. oleracea]|nr:PREDICTED: uncharacterized protein LOC106303020 [Brassica oleracea var. oleracea]